MPILSVNVNNSTWTQKLFRYGGFYFAAVVFFAIFCVLQKLHVGLFPLFLGLTIGSFILSIFLEWITPLCNIQLQERQLSDDIVAAFVDRFIYAAVVALIVYIVNWVIQPLLVYSPNLTKNWSPWIAYPVLILAMDFGFYWAHRLIHKNHFLWKSHAMHHASDVMYFLNQYHRDPYGVLFFNLFAFPILLFLGVDDQFIIFRAALGIFITGFQHLNADIRLGYLNYIFSCSPCHIFHHSNDPKYGNTNFGTITVFWDIVFGTYTNPNKNPMPDELGLYKSNFYDFYPRVGFFKQFIAPHVSKYWNYDNIEQKK